MKSLCKFDRKWDQLWDPDFLACLMSCGNPFYRQSSRSIDLETLRQTIFHISSNTSFHKENKQSFSTLHLLRCMYKQFWESGHHKNN
jgi:hypothetical protein